MTDIIIYKNIKIRYVSLSIWKLFKSNLIDKATNKNVIPVNTSNKRYLILIFVLQYLHLPPKKI